MIPVFYRYYNNFNEGEFVMYKHATLPYEVGKSVSELI